MTGYYLIEVKKENFKKAESALIHGLIDRKELVSMCKLLEIHKKPNLFYFVIGGEDFSCKIVMRIFQQNFESRRLHYKFFSSNSLKLEGLNDLLWCVDSNNVGKVVKNYVNNEKILNKIKEKTNDFLIENKIMSRFALCKTKGCEGFGDAVELSSLKGHYHCSYCGEDIFVDGPLVSRYIVCKKEDCNGYVDSSEFVKNNGDCDCPCCGEKIQGDAPSKAKQINIKHLSEKEQLYLIGIHKIEESLKSKDSTDIDKQNKQASASDLTDDKIIPISPIEGEQLSWREAQQIEEVAPTKVKRKRLISLLIRDVKSPKIKIKQLSLELA